MIFYWNLYSFYFSNRTKFRRTIFSAPTPKISAILSDENFSSVSYFPHTLYKKTCFNMSFILIWRVLNFSWQNISADKIFGSKSYFRQFCPPKFCSLWYLIFFFILYKNLICPWRYTMPLISVTEWSLQTGSLEWCLPRPLNCINWGNWYFSKVTIQTARKNMCKNN